MITSTFPSKTGFGKTSWGTNFVVIASWPSLRAASWNRPLIARSRFGTWTAVHRCLWTTVKFLGRWPHFRYRTLSATHSIPGGPLRRSGYTQNVRVPIWSCRNETFVFPFSFKSSPTNFQCITSHCHFVDPQVLSYSPFPWKRKHALAPPKDFLIDKRTKLSNEAARWLDWPRQPKESVIGLDTQTADPSNVGGLGLPLQQVI